jgi:hypothetical protein
MAVLRGEGLEPLPQRKFFAELGGLMKYVCGLITQEPDALKSCTAGLPTTLPSSQPVLGVRTPVVVGKVIEPVSHVLRDSNMGGGGNAATTGTGPVPSQVTLTNGDTIPKFEFQTIQANLCVKPTGQPDSDTKEAARQAKIGARQSGQAAGTLPFNNA